VVAAFRDHYQVPLVAVDARTASSSAFKGVTDRKPSARSSAPSSSASSEEEAAKIEDVKYLVQGTLSRT